MLTNHRGASERELRAQTSCTAQWRTKQTLFIVGSTNMNLLSLEMATRGLLFFFFLKWSQKIHLLLQQTFVSFILQLLHVQSETRHDRVGVFHTFFYFDSSRVCRLSWLGTTDELFAISVVRTFPQPIKIKVDSKHIKSRQRKTIINNFNDMVPKIIDC